MTHAGEVQTECGCQYTITLIDQLVQENTSEMKDNYNHALSIHEVVEEDTDEECNNEGPSLQEYNQDMELKKAIMDDESAYSGDSFCSDDSSDESDETSKFSPNAGLSVEINNYKLENDNRCGSSKLKKNQAENQDEEDDEDDETICSSHGDKNSRFGEKQLGLKHIKAGRKNMSFTDEEMRKIERENQLLLRKIMAYQKPRGSLHHNTAPQSRTSSSAINRKKLQRKIEIDNMLLLQRIQRAKPSVMNTAMNSGCRLTFV